MHIMTLRDKILWRLTHMQCLPAQKALNVRLRVSCVNEIGRLMGDWNVDKGQIMGLGGNIPMAPYVTF